MFRRAPGWPAVLSDGPVLLRPYRRSDAAAWSQVRRANREWLAPGSRRYRVTGTS
ncbi:hypothetical protein GCM10029963_39570 [Micromonospora andamanensis]